MSNTEFMLVVDPTAEDQPVSQSIAPRLVTLAGTRIGLIDNSKHMALPTLQAIEALLKERYGVAAFSYYRKDNPSVPTPPDVLADMGRTCDAVLHGIAD